MRKEKEKDTPEAENIKSLMEEGKLVPSEVLVELIRKEVINDKGEGIYLLDGFPRNIENLEVWDRVMKGSLLLLVILNRFGGC